jgi:glycerol kinase
LKKEKTQKTYLKKHFVRKKYFLILDIGTSGTKGVLFDTDLNLIDQVRAPFNMSHPEKGWVEEDPKELYQKSVRVLKRVLEKAHVLANQIISFGITNQRETTIVWDQKTGKPVYPAIVWEDVRTKAACKKLKEHAEFVRERTGLTIDPYFSATKIDWILSNVPKAKELHGVGRLRFGTVDTWILWNLTMGKVHATDETNASRTLLFDVHNRNWSRQLLHIFHVPRSILPIVKHSQDDYGVVDKSVFGREIPIRALCGDQQSSMYAAGARRGVTKVTYGTGTFIGQHLGSMFAICEPFFTAFMPSGKTAQFALEGKIARGGKEVEPLLGNPKKLETFLYKLASDVDKLLKQLPTQPKKILIDGGVMCDGIVGSFQHEISRVKVEPLSVVNGTAYGVAKLLRESFEK